MILLIKEQGGCDLAAFGGENIVGSAGGLQIHDFKADPGCRERVHQGGWRKSQAFAGTEQDDFDVEHEQLLHVSVAQGANCCGRPVFQKFFWHDNQAFFVFLMVDRNMIITVSGE